MAVPAEWITPRWPAPANVRAVCTTRAGGRSRAPYESLNLGDHVGDSVQAVAANRAVFAATLQARPMFLKQMHGLHSVRLDANTPEGIEADDCVTTTRSIACTIMMADCLPVLFATADGRAVAAAHAGWRGLADGAGRNILEAVWIRFRELAQLRSPDQTLAWLGPCIGPDAFEVGPEVKTVFDSNDPVATALFKAQRDGKWLADLAGLARRRLHALGITRVYGNDGSREWCTVSNPSRFFSHRRDRISGRFAAGIWLP